MKWRSQPPKSTPIRHAVSERGVPKVGHIPILLKYMINQKMGFSRAAESMRQIDGETHFTKAL